ncbi:MAG: ribosome maturation factor RimM, partial [Dissulfurimicrobium sp.]
LGIEGIKDRGQAEGLVGLELFLEKVKLPKLPEGEYYWHEIIGLQVMTFDGGRLGVVSDIIETGANDVYVVKTSGKDVLIPAIKDVVKEIDLEAGIIKVALISGLLDDLG